MRASANTVKKGRMSKKLNKIVQYVTNLFYLFCDIMRLGNTLKNHKVVKHTYTLA